MRVQGDGVQCVGGAYGRAGTAGEGLGRERGEDERHCSSLMRFVFCAGCWRVSTICPMASSEIATIPGLDAKRSRQGAGWVQVGRSPPYRAKLLITAVYHLGGSTRGHLRRAGFGLKKHAPRATARFASRRGRNSLLYLGGDWRGRGPSAVRLSKFSRALS